MSVFVLAGLFVLAMASTAIAGVLEVRLFVDGVSCPFCTFGIEESLKKIAGVLEIETSIKTGEVRIRWNPAKPLDPVALNRAVRKAGFTPKGMEGDIQGEGMAVDGIPVFRADLTGQLFVLKGVKGTPTLEVMTGVIQLSSDGSLSLAAGKEEPEP